MEVNAVITYEGAQTGLQLRMRENDIKMDLRETACKTGGSIHHVQDMVNGGLLLTRY
jgi:hypothetical protein